MGPQQLPPRGVALIVGAVLIGMAPGVPPASALPTDRVVGAGRDTAKSVQAIPDPPRSLPSETPAAKAPAAPPVSAKPPPRPAPTRPAPAPPSPPPGPTVKAPSFDGASAGTGGSGGSVRSAGTGSSGGPVASAGPEATAAVASTGADGGNESAYRGSGHADPSNAGGAAGAASGAPPSIRAAEVAPASRWLARIWPAIALGGGAGSAPAPVAVALAMAEDLFRPAAAVVARVLALTSSNAPTPASLPSIEQPGTANAPHPTLPGAAVAADEEKILYLVALLGLLALLALTVWREFRSALRPRGVRWHL